MKFWPLQQTAGFAVFPELFCGFYLCVCVCSLFYFEHILIIHVNGGQCDIFKHA